MVSSLGLGYIPGLRNGPNILETEGIAMLQRRRAPLFSGLAATFAAFALTAAPAESQTRMPPPVQQMPLDPPGAATAPPSPSAPAPQSAPVGNPGGNPAMGAPPAAIAVDPYAVSGVTVDVSAANANAARDQAIREAQTKAWGELYKRLVPGGGNAPRLSDRDLARVVQGFEIDDERVSATRYLGSMTVRFRPNAVREILAGSTQQFVEPPSKPFVVLPVTVVGGRPVLWEDRTAWRAAWEERPAQSSLVPLLVPDGELSDISAIGVQEALEGNPDALARIAQRYGAGGVVVAKAALPDGEPDLSRPLSVEMVRYGADGQREEQTVSVKPDADDRPEDVLMRATGMVSAALDESWRRDNLVASGPEQSTIVRVPLSRLDDWVEARKRLAGVPGLTRTEILSLTRDEAILSLTHRGDVQSLRQALARRDLGLAQDTPPLMPSGIPGQPPLTGHMAQWQLLLQPHAGMEPPSAYPQPGYPQPGYPQPQPGYVPAPTYPAQPYSGQPSQGQQPYQAQPYPGQQGGAPGAPPRSLGTLPATGGVSRF